MSVLRTSVQSVGRRQDRGITEMQMLIEAVGMLVIVEGVLVFGLACAWSARTLKRETGLRTMPH